MFIITYKENNQVFDTDSQLDYMENGYPRLVNKDVAFPTEMFNVFEVSELPEGFEPFRYCYTDEDGFTINQDWVDPDPTNIYNVPDEVYHNIIDDYTLDLIGGAE